MKQPGEGHCHVAAGKKQTSKLLRMPWIGLIALWLSGASIVVYRYFARPPYVIDHYLAGIQLLCIGVMVLWVALLLHQKSIRSREDKSQ